MQSWTAGCFTIFAAEIRSRTGFYTCRRPCGRDGGFTLWAKGGAKKLVHKIETHALETLPGETLYYSGQKELRGNLEKMLGRVQTVAMQYSAKNAIPYVAMVDAG